jgi:hypothetical protein
MMNRKLAALSDERNAFRSARFLMPSHFCLFSLRLRASVVNLSSSLISFVTFRDFRGDLFGLLSEPSECSVANRVSVPPW